MWEEAIFMANPEHLEILKQGVVIWNKWRKENPSIQPDLSNIDLHRITIQLTTMNLTGANMYHAFGYGLFAFDADFSEANFKNALFSDCKFHGSKFRKADMSKSKFEGCVFHAVDFEHANMKEASLYTSHLSANFQGADLSGADLRCCQLINAIFRDANITGVRLWGTARELWKIKGVRCGYVYWDPHGERRCPKDRDFALGEFEKLYAQLPIIEYVFENGMTPIDPLIMDRVVASIRKKLPKLDIKIDSISARGLAPSIKFTVQQEEYKEQALKEVTKGYEERIKRLENDKEKLYTLLGRAIDKTGVKLIEAKDNSVVINESIINIEQHINYALELQRIIEEAPKENFSKIAKRTALDLIGDAIKDIAKGQIKEAAKQIFELSKDIGPLIINTTAYTFFKSILGQ
jgi:hypothetical protein